MTVIGIDDTDSRTMGMCTTYVGHKIANRLKSHDHSVQSVVLYRLNPAVKHKTRGNACVSIHTDATPDEAMELAYPVVEMSAREEDEKTNPGIVVCKTVPGETIQFAQEAVKDIKTKETAKSVLPSNAIVREFGNGRGIIGATAAIGSKDVLEHSLQDSTYEYIAYRERYKWGTKREVDEESMISESNRHYPKVWDTVDRTEQEAVAVPNTPCPVLFGVRGDSKEEIKQTAHSTKCEEIDESRMFITNQGTDMHLTNAELSEIKEDKSYTIESVEVSDSPHTQSGGHVFFTVCDGSDSIQCAAFEPTKRFRDKIRKLTEGDKLTVCGEVSKGTIKLEKIKVESLRKYRLTNPTCPKCQNSMESAGSNAGYRCRNCKTKQESKIKVQIDRDLETGWYEVPPFARRHISKPLIRGDFNGTVHVEC
jgi:tRNA(Ile2)-agmatinylcytidine synthase